MAASCFLHVFTCSTEDLTPELKVSQPRVESVSVLDMKLNKHKLLQFTGSVVTWNNINIMQLSIEKCSADQKSVKCLVFSSSAV